MVGGGTGGHITPLLAVARELKRKDSTVRVIAVVDKSTTFAGPLEKSADIEVVFRISAGKLRRYPNQSLRETLLDVKTIALNIRDGFRTLVGCVQAFRILSKEKPSVIFIKGGFVGVPVGIAAHIQRRPFITHDSDSEPGLANRIIGRWAELHTVGFNASLYRYPPSKVREVGVPISDTYKPLTKKQQQTYKKELGIPIDAKLLLVVGGSQGSTTINEIMSKIAPELLKTKNLYIIHQTGSDSNNEIESERYVSLKFIPDLFRYSGAADLVMSRSGSFLSELSAQKKATLVIPAPQLAGGHQVKNAEFLSERKAVRVVDQTTALHNPKKLEQEITNLLNNSAERLTLADNLFSSFKHDAAIVIADMLLERTD